MIALLVAAQLTPMAPLPQALEPIIDRYGKCLFDPSKQPQVIKGGRESDVLKKSLGTCKPLRRTSINDAEDALRNVAGFEDARTRRAFIEDRFDRLDALVEGLASGGLDPDNWEN